MKRSKPDLPRLQRFLSECGVASRRAAEDLITAGKVSVNGTIVTELGTRVDPDKSVIRVSNRIVKQAPKGILLLHKPTGVVSTLSDPEGRRSIADYMTKHYKSYFPVGRLDWDSSGLVVLTNDGDLANVLLHPRYRVERVYHARVEGIPSQRTLELLAKGVKLSDGKASCHAEVFEASEEHSWVEVSLSEGRNRIVRRMFEHVGHPIDKLKRISHGPFRLGTLRPGDLRRLTEREYLRLKREVERAATAPEEKKLPSRSRTERTRAKGTRPSRGLSNSRLGRSRQERNSASEVSSSRVTRRSSRDSRDSRDSNQKASRPFAPRERKSRGHSKSSPRRRPVR